MRFFGVVLLAACSGPTELVVIVDSDLGVPTELDEVRLTITGPSGTPRAAEQALGPSGRRLPLTLGVTSSNDGLGPVLVQADGMLDGSVVVTRTARTQLLRGERLALYLFLPRDCRGVACPTGETCTENGCAPVEIDPELLPPWTGTIPPRDGGFDGGATDGGRADAAFPDAGPRLCETGAECDDGIECTRDACTDGVCTHAPDDSSCTAAADGRCDVANDCQYTTCTPATCVAAPCQTAMCVGTSCVRAGLCGSGEMCCAGACAPVGCDDGELCTTDACGATGCENVPNTLACDDGVFCNGGDTCSAGACSAHAGTPCAGSAVCDEDLDQCTGCLVDADCGPPVLGGWGACGGFADDCDETGTRTRARTTFTCASGSCMPSATTDSEQCPRDTDGTTCDATTCGGYGACGGFSDMCDESGSESRTCTDFTCVAGACQGTTRGESRGCGRTTGGMMCAPRECDPCGACTDDLTDVCDQNGTCLRPCTNYACSGGTCRGTAMNERISCSRPTEGVFCEDGYWCTEMDRCSGGVCIATNDICSNPCMCTSSGCVDPGGSVFCPIK